MRSIRHASFGKPSDMRSKHAPAQANQIHNNKSYLFTCAAGVFALLSSNIAMANTASAPTASITRSIKVQGSPDAVWAAIGPFCSIAAWHPAIASCSENGKVPPTRILKTRAGDATFIERQLSRNESKHSYSYTFTSAPIPVTNYKSTLRVLPNGHRGSTVTWSGLYMPNPGMDQAAAKALGGIYETGLRSIKARLAKAKR